MVPSLQLICRQQSHHQEDFIAFFGKKDFIIGEQVSRKLKKELPQTKIIIKEKDKYFNFYYCSPFNHSVI